MKSFVSFFVNNFADKIIVHAEPIEVMKQYLWSDIDDVLNQLCSQYNVSVENKEEITITNGNTKEVVERMVFVTITDEKKC